MAKGGIGKLISVIKKWQSKSKLGRPNGPPATTPTATPTYDDDDEYSSFSPEKRMGVGLQPVYVGKSRRRYLIGSDIIDHPIFRELVDRSGGSDEATVGCEVVMFDHLLWMLENGETDQAPESMEELVGFYAC